VCVRGFEFPFVNVIRVYSGRPHNQYVAVLVCLQKKDVYRQPSRGSGQQGGEGKKEAEKRREIGKPRDESGTSGIRERRVERGGRGILDKSEA